MLGKRIGDPCPKCAGRLIRHRVGASFRSAAGDVAFCARCNAAWELVEEDQPVFTLPPLPRPA